MRERESASDMFISCWMCRAVWPAHIHVSRLKWKKDKYKLTFVMHPKAFNGNAFWFYKHLTWILPSLRRRKSKLSHWTVGCRFEKFCQNSPLWPPAPTQVTRLGAAPLQTNYTCPYFLPKQTFDFRCTPSEESAPLPSKMWQAFCTHHHSGFVA